MGNFDSGQFDFDVVVLGAGLAGMTAAYELRDVNLVVLEREDRVGGRAFSGSWEGYWYNIGAQFVWDERTLNYCRRLGLEYRDASGARAAIYLRGRLVDAPNPYLLLLKMPLYLREKLNFALTIIRLRRTARRLPRLDRFAVDSSPLLSLMPGALPTTKQILDQVSKSGTGLPTDEVSGLIGLGYAIHLFGGDVNETLKGVVGGTQQITQAMLREVGPERVRLDCQVLSVQPLDGGVEVSYAQGGSQATLRARACVCTLPIPAVLRALKGLPADKRDALERKLPYERGITVVWPTGEREPMPWDQLLHIPVVGGCIDLISNPAFFLRHGKNRRRPGGVLVTLGKAEVLWDLGDDEVRSRVKEQLEQVFPGTRHVFQKAIVHRWEGMLPLFRPGSLRDQETIRKPLGSIYFAGDYTAQPGTPGAVGSAYYAAHAVREQLRTGA